MWIDYQMNVVVRINKDLTANVALQTIYDDNSVQAVQVEIFGIEELWLLKLKKQITP
jgi:hypothetical protein